MHATGASAGKSKIARHRLRSAAVGGEKGREVRLWALAVQGGSVDRLPDTDDGGPPDAEGEVVTVRLPPDPSGAGN